MPTLHMRQRWAPWWIGLPLLAAYLGFGYLLVGTLNQPNQATRIFLPVYAVLGALVLPAALNSRIITAGPHGVRVTNGPIPLGRKINLEHDAIWACNVRAQYSRFRSEHGSWGDVENYIVGVETRNAQFDVAYPYLKVEEARAVVERLAAALNEDRQLRAIPIARASFEPNTSAGWRMKVLSWTGVFILAILAGAVWESY